MTRFAAIQTVSTPDVDRNLAAAGRLVAQAAQAGAQWVALPEYFCLMGRRDDAQEIIRRLRAITPVVIPDASFLRNPEHRELILSGLRLAAGEPP